MPVDISDKGAVRTITINRPEKLNALSLEIATDICNAVEAAATDSSVRCLLLTGAGRAFSTGGDVNEMGE
ncbi:MAG: enoyl-CoA hydratase/isomerase family protein, partial [Candidatus Thermoplasmatota archaeon]|nr:enoyl-CoA hydratase/isomerase family protein [Candidatus Thermoplasmatota archaeon]